MSVSTIIFPVRDRDAAKSVFTALLGAEPYVDESYYVGYRVDGQEIGLDPNGHRSGLTGPVPFWAVDDIEASCAALTAAGVSVTQAPREVGGGRRTAVVTDPDGNQIGLMQG
ncbi:MAG: glyoxalase [Humibacillus sp.]|nr:glyoxalase [Humibacillus sp.]